MNILKPIGDYWRRIMPRICFDTDELEEKVTHLSNRLTDMEIHIMATLQDVTNALAALQQTAEDEKTEVLAALDTLRAEITALQEQVAAGAGVTPADLDAVVAALNTAQATVEGIQEPPAPPVEPVPA